MMFYDNTAPTPKPITPFHAYTSPERFTYRAVIPVANMPANGETIFTIKTGSETLTGTYTAIGVAAGKRLLIDLKYDNKRTLTTTATVTPWQTGPTYNAQTGGYDMLIRTADDLAAFRNLVNGGLNTLTAIQTADITLTGEWTPITPFKGTYNGGGNTITGLKINAGGNNYQGLFGATIGATLTGINLIEPTVTGGYYVGALVGDAGTGTHISNCSITDGTIKGESYIGGLVGFNDGNIVACYASAAVTATDINAGGLVGYNCEAITFCYATGTVTGDDSGALVGINDGGGGTITSCYAGTDPLTDRTGSVTIRTGLNSTRTITAAKDINFAKGTKNTLAITLKVEEQDKRTAAMSVTTKDWTIGTDEAVEVIRFITPTDPVTGEPSIKKFTVMKNGAEPTIYEYANGTWSATPEFFLVEDTEPTDEFTATATLGNADAISGLTDELTAGPAAMNNEGIINLEFSHTLAKLKITLHKGDGFTDDLTTAKVTYKNFNYTGDAKEFIINPATFATGEVIATVQVGTHTYEAKAAKDINFAKGTTNKLAITLKVEEQGKRTAAMSVTTKDWTTGTDEVAEAIRFIAPTNPATGVPTITEFTVMKNGAEATLYTYDNGTWSATPAFFTIEDTEPTDVFTATATGATDGISRLTDELVAGPAMMSNEGIINLEFSHTLAKLSIRLYAGQGFTDDALLPDAQVTYKDAQGDISYTGADETFFINPGSFAAGDVIAVVTVNSKTYDAVAAGDTDFAAGTSNTLNITLKVEQQGKTQAGLNVTSKEWTPTASMEAEGTSYITPVAPGDGSTEVPEFTLYKNKGAAEEMSVVYKLVGTAYEPQGGIAPFYLEDVVSTDEFIGQHIGSADAVTGVNDIIQTPAVTPDASGVIALQFSHINAKLTLNLVKGATFMADLSGASVKLLSYTPTASGASNDFILAPQTIPEGLIATITLAGLTYEARLSNNLTLVTGEHTTMQITLEPTAAAITVTGVTPWGAAEPVTTKAAVTLSTGSITGLPTGTGTLTLTCNGKTGTYTWNSTAITTPITNLYWEDIQGGGAYNFTLTFTPTATTPGPVKDVLEGTASVANSGYGATTPSFTLAHKNSKITVVLKNGNYTGAGEWAAITGNTNKTTVAFAGLDTYAAQNYDYTGSGLEAIFTPKATLADTDVITVTVPATTSPVLPASSIEVVLNKRIAGLQAGKAYTLEITLNKNNVAVGDIEVTEWGNITGTGDIEY